MSGPSFFQCLSILESKIAKATLPGRWLIALPTKVVLKISSSGMKRSPMRLHQ